MAVSKQQIRAMRWLYEDDKSFAKAVNKLRVQDLKERKENDQLKQHYKEQISEKVHKLKKVLPETKQLTDGHIFTLPRVSVNKTVLKAIVGTGLAVIAYAFLAQPLINRMQTEITAGEISSTQEAVIDSTPTFEIATPTSTAAAETVRFDEQKQVASFVDRIDDVSVTVSMQPLPAEFRDEPQSHIENIATSFGASQKVTTSTPQAFRGASTEGIETIIFTKKDLLVFIQSANKLNDQALAEYITSLQ